MANNLALATALALLAYAVLWYRSRGKGHSPDSTRYLLMAEGHAQPSPYSRRWLLPMLLKSRRAWAIATGIAYVSIGPLIYELTGSLACAWLALWLPGLTLGIRLPVLNDAVAMALMLGAAVACKHDQIALAMVLVFVCGQVKESAPIFGALLCGHWLVGVAGLVSMAVAIGVGARSSAEPDAAHQISPFRVARAKHDPLDWKSMLLPWGSVAVFAVVLGVELNTATVVAMVSVALGYGQLLIANDEPRLYQWSSAAVLVALAPYMGGPWLVPLLVAHPFLCAQGKQV